MLCLLYVSLDYCIVLKVQQTDDVSNEACPITIIIFNSLQWMPFGLRWCVYVLWLRVHGKKKKKLERVKLECTCYIYIKYAVKWTSSVSSEY